MDDLNYVSSLSITNNSGIYENASIKTDDFLALFTSTASSIPSHQTFSSLTTTTTNYDINKKTNRFISNFTTSTATAIHQLLSFPTPPSPLASSPSFTSSLSAISAVSTSSHLTTPLDEITDLGNSLSDINSTVLPNNETLFHFNFKNNTQIFNTNYNLINDSNVTTIRFNGTYPSGYTLTHIIIASIIVTILMIIIVVGNMLVIIAIATEKSLKNIQNWFIASLAVADFFLGLVIMPFSLANELMGYWIFGDWWCDIHSAMDVLLCTASIMNLCLISLDRYWSITKAVEYLKSRTPARAAVMIAAVWIMSGLICIPPLLGWKVKQPEGQDLPQCQLSEDIGYVLYSALGSFYIPSCIMVFVYIRIYFAAKARARRGIKKQPRKLPNEQVTSFSKTSGKSTVPMPSGSSAAAYKQKQQIATIETPTGGQNNEPPNVPIPVVTCELASDISTSDPAEIEVHQYSNNKETLRLSTITSQNSQNPSLHANISSHNNNNSGNCCNSTISAQSSTITITTTTVVLTSPTNKLGNELKVSPIQSRARALSFGVDTDMVSEFDPSSSDSGVISRCAVVKPLKFRLCQPIFGRKKNQRNDDVKGIKNNYVTTTNKSNEIISPAESEPVIPKVQKPRDPEKEKRRIARKKEKRATLILGLIMGSFIACWLPFFLLYILTPACSQCEIPQSAFAVAFWLGYMNSALNPAIYTIFNKDFRRAFRRILFK
ncbi:alpha-2C adrenergic receptor isoform X1 [Condylostylus longicornis]|uniref:alpha-2C adrenergic receptor isoform X1 n=1 Tax=Condylostylus longicornis TaxID=2530218 RepID=UPI00244DC9FE|nr:alpha-2C adrenergic receptor isoform X1 [Condylostylus longicornis]